MHFRPYLVETVSGKIDQNWPNYIVPGVCACVWAFACVGVCVCVRACVSVCVCLGVCACLSV